MDLSGNYITLRPIAKAEPETLARLLNNRKIWDQLRDYLPTLMAWRMPGPTRRDAPRNHPPIPLAFFGEAS